MKMIHLFSIDLLELEWNNGSSLGNEALTAIKSFDAWNFSLEQYTETALENT
ncbi:hypothetical protein [Planococcus lenghuensis]|uniref:hypothetical protein n=1 Tax=Planococcus lenghuensis TaxID=2213202 RepID=UPI0012EC5743|nr:hypothetical protein [Planococcus lenghuensis]